MISNVDTHVCVLYSLLHMESKNTLVSTPVAILLGCFMISVSLLLSGGVIKIGKTTGIAAAPTAPAAPAAPAAPQAPAAPTTAKASVDDDPIIGDKNAPITLIEFSDYECPFCKRHFEQTYTQLKKDYIDTGKVKLVFRDYPLPFHDPLATTQAMAATCVKEQAGDEAYFKFHDELFKATQSNGQGMTLDAMYGLATNLGLNADSIKACVDSGKYKEEVAKDIADGGAAGVSGTPSFIIGKSTGDGTIDGKILVGAQPISAFQAAIDELLK